MTGLEPTGCSNWPVRRRSAGGFQARVVDAVEEMLEGTGHVTDVGRVASNFIPVATPPCHVYRAEGIDTLTHFTSSSMPC